MNALMMIAPCAIEQAMYQILLQWVTLKNEIIFNRLIVNDDDDGRLL